MLSNPTDDVLIPGFLNYLSRVFEYLSKQLVTLMSGS